MRVISGKVRGLKLNAPKNDDVRPTTDRVKESLFNMINSYMMDSDILDLFAGTGSLGIECLSRGANKCVFVDKSKESINIVKSNIKKARVENESIVLNLDFKSAISSLALKKEKFDGSKCESSQLKEEKQKVVITKNNDNNWVLEEFTLHE